MTGMSNMNFLIADVIQFVSGTMTTFSQADGTKIKSEQFSEFRSRTKNFYENKQLIWKTL